MEKRNDENNRWSGRPGAGELETQVRFAECIWPGRVLRLPDNLTYNACLRFEAQFDRMADASDKPIILICDSVGKNMAASIMLADIVRHSEVHVMTLVFGRATTPAVRVFAAGQMRLMQASAVLEFGPLESLGLEWEERMFQVRRCRNYDTVMQGYRRVNRLQLESLAGCALPDCWFREKGHVISFGIACSLGLADGLFAGPPEDSWQKVREVGLLMQATATLH